MRVVFREVTFSEVDPNLPKHLALLPTFTEHFQQLPASSTSNSSLKRLHDFLRFCWVAAAYRSFLDSLARFGMLGQIWGSI